jgi:hypothetical protein
MRVKHHCDEPENQDNAAIMTEILAGKNQYTDSAWMRISELARGPEGEEEQDEEAKKRGKKKRGKSKKGKKKI